MVVLATLLHRAPPLHALFRDDPVLWAAYRKTLAADAHRSAYAALLADLDSRLAL